MHWQDEGYLLSKHNYNENSIIIEAFTLKHGKHTGIVYGGSSRKQKRNFQIGNKILINYISKGESRSGYFNVELVKPIAPLFFDDKKKSTCLVAASSILKILLPDREVNEKIYYNFENLLNTLSDVTWINNYIFWELSLIKDLGFEYDYINKTNNILINEQSIKIPKILNEKKMTKLDKNEIMEALIFNKNLFIENFITPNKLKLPLSRNLLEIYYS
jgi:DNA repair protein RecO (recombination protein O)